MSNSLVTPWTVAHQAPLSMGFSRQEYWSGLPFLPPGDFPSPGTEPASLALAGGFFTADHLGSPGAGRGTSKCRKSTVQMSSAHHTVPGGPGEESGLVTGKFLWVFSLGSMPTQGSEKIKRDHKLKREKFISMFFSKFKLKYDISFIYKCGQQTCDFVNNDAIRMLLDLPRALMVNVSQLCDYVFFIFIFYSFISLTMWHMGS